MTWGNYITLRYNRTITTLYILFIDLVKALRSRNCSPSLQGNTTAVSITCLPNKLNDIIISMFCTTQSPTVHSANFYVIVGFGRSQMLYRQLMSSQFERIKLPLKTLYESGFRSKTPIFTLLKMELLLTAMFQDQSSIFVSFNMPCNPGIFSAK